MENNLLSDKFHDILENIEKKNQEGQYTYIAEKVKKNKDRIIADVKADKSEKASSCEAQDNWAVSEREKVKTQQSLNREKAYNNFYRKTNVKPQLIILNQSFNEFKKHVMWYGFTNISKDGSVACNKNFYSLNQENNPTPFMDRFKEFKIHENFIVNIFFSLVFAALTIWAVYSKNEASQNMDKMKQAGITDYISDSKDTCDCFIDTKIDKKIAYYRDTLNTTVSYDSTKVLTNAIRKAEISKLLKQKEYNAEDNDSTWALVFILICGAITTAFFIPWTLHNIKAISKAWPDKKDFNSIPFSQKYTLKQLKTLVFPERESYGYNGYNSSNIKCELNFCQATKDSLENVTKVIDSGMEWNALCHENGFEIKNFADHKVKYDDAVTAPHPIFYSYDSSTGLIIIYAGIHEAPAMDKDSISKSILSKLPTNLHELGRELEEQGAKKGGIQLKNLHTAFNGLVSMLGTKFQIDEKAYQSYLLTAKDLYEGGLDNLHQIKALLQTTGVIEEKEIADSLSTLEKSEGRTVQTEMDELRKRRKMRDNTAKMIEDLYVQNEQIINSILETTFNLSQIKHSDDKSGDMIKEAMELLKEKADNADQLTAKPLNNN